MKRKIFAAVLAAVISVLCLIPLAGCSEFLALYFPDEDGDEHDFTVLAVKEENVKDYNSMPVFKALNNEAGKDVYYTFNTSMQYSNNTDPVGTKGIDAIYHANFSNLQLYNYGSRGRIVAIDSYLDAMPRFKAILEARPDIAEALKSPDGHIYSLPRVEEMGLKAFPNILFLNKKWVERLIAAGDMPVNLGERKLEDGLDLTRNELKAILQKFADYDFASGGKTVPLSFAYKNWQGNISDLIASFGVPENIDHKTIVDDKIVFTVEDKNWFNAIKELNDWYSRGLIRTTAFTQTENDFLAKGQDGRYGAFYWWEKNTVLASEHRDDYIVVKPLIDDNTGKRYVGLSNDLEVEKGECVILGSCKDKKGLLSYFDNFFIPDYSAQLNYGSIESGAFERQKQDGKLIPNDDHGRQSADDFRAKNAAYGVVYLTKEVWETSVQMESRAQLRLDILEEYVKPYAFENAKSIPNLNYTKDELDTLNRYENTLVKDINSWLVKKITANGAPTESDWQNNLVKKYSAQINTVKRVNQAAYDRYLSATGD